MAAVVEALNSLSRTHSRIRTVAEKLIRNLQYIHHRVVSLLEQLQG
jgi:hypothetical protein